jgi:hypothetical protein
MPLNIIAIIVPAPYILSTSAAHPAPLLPLIRVSKRLWDLVHLETQTVHLLEMLFHLIRSNVIVRRPMVFVRAGLQARCCTRVQKAGVSDLVFMK